MVIITKQRHISCWNTTDVNRRFTSSKVRSSGLRPEPFQLHWPHWLLGMRQRVSAWKTTRLYFRWCTRAIFHRGFSRTKTWNVRLFPEFQRLRDGRCIFSQSNKRTWMFSSSAAVPGLPTDPFSILLGARRLTQVTSQTNCFFVLPGRKGDSIRALSVCSSQTIWFHNWGSSHGFRRLFHESNEVVVPPETSRAQERPWYTLTSTNLPQRQECFSQFLNERISRKHYK